MDDKPSTKTESPKNRFESEAEQESPGLFSEFWYFLRHNKKWWLTPIIVVLLMVGLLLASGSPAVSFLYPFF